MSVGVSTQSYGQRINNLLLDFIRGDRKALIVAKLSGVPLDTVPDFTMKDTKTEEYKSKFPLGQAPGFETKDGKLLTESCAIAQYVAEQKPNNPLLGKDSWERAEILKFTLLSEAQIIPTYLDILYPFFKLRKFDKDVVDKAKDKFDGLLQVLDSALKEGNPNFICCDRFTIADVELVNILSIAFVFCITPEIRAKYSTLTKYFLDHAEKEVFKSNLSHYNEQGLCKKDVYN